MRQFMYGLSVSLAFIAGCVASQLSHFVVPPARAGTSVQRWEYFCVGQLGNHANDDVKAKLNALGQEGWELVLYESNYHNLCFKRPVQ